MNVRLLGPHDAAACHRLRLRGLREAPLAFGSSYEEEKNYTLEQVAAYLLRTQLFGAWRTETELVGIVGLDRNKRAKARHKAMLGGMYVAPEARRQGVARALLDAVFTYARSQPGLERINLMVVADNDAALALYEAAGFVRFGYEPRALRYAGRYFDLLYLTADLAMAGRPAVG